MLLGPHRSFAHTIGDIEEILQTPNGGDDHDEAAACWYHQPSSVHRAEVVSSRRWGKEGRVGLGQGRPGRCSPGSFLCPLVAVVSQPQVCSQSWAIKGFRAHSEQHWENLPLMDACKGKTQFSNFLCGETPSSSQLGVHREHFTSELLFTKCVEVLSNTNKQLSDTSRGLVNSTQFQHYLLGDSVRSHRLRTQSHETAPHFGY